MHPRLLLSSLSARRRARLDRSLQVRVRQEARNRVSRLVGLGVCDSIATMTGRAPTPRTGAWVPLASYLLGLFCISGVLGLLVRAFSQ